MEHAMSHTEVIAALGGHSRLALILGVSESTTWGWTRTSIPPHRWGEVAELAAAKGVAGITVESLSRADTAARGAGRP